MATVVGLYLTILLVIFACGMRFSAAKGNIMRVSRKQTPIPYQYELSGQVLEEVKDAKYLGVTVSDDLEWSWLSTSTEPQSEDLRGPPGHIPNFQRALHTSGNKSQQQKQHLEGLGRHYLGTTEGDDTDDLQGNRKVGRKLRCPSLEYQCKRHQYRKDSNCAERSPENSHRITQDVKHRSPPQ